MKQINRLWLVMALVGMTAGPAVLAKEKQVVTVSYWLAPSRPLPTNIHAVAVIDSGVESIDGIKGNSREKKWSTIAADMIEAMLQGDTEGASSGLTVVQRRATKQILAEQDLQLAGIVEGDAAMKAGKLLAVQGLIESKISIHIDTKRTVKSSIDWTGVLGGTVQTLTERRREVRYRQPRGGPPGYYDNPYRRRERTNVDVGIVMPTREVEEISRNLTVQCSFSLIDATSGAGVVQFSPPVFQKTDKKSPDFMFGRCVDAADLDPVDHFIGELVERACREFVGMMAPVRVAYTYEIVGRGDEGEAAVRAVRADDYATAVRLFEASLAKKPKEDATVFALGVTCELAGDYKHALDYYRQASAMPKVDKDDLQVYLAAKNRLTEQMDRILVPQDRKGH